MVDADQKRYSVETPLGEYNLSPIHQRLCLLLNDEESAQGDTGNIENSPAHSGFGSGRTETSPEVSPLQSGSSESGSAESSPVHRRLRLNLLRRARTLGLSFGHTSGE